MATKKKRKPIVRTYTHVHEMMASATSPTPESAAKSQLTRIWNGLANLESAPTPTINDWRLCSDAVNLLETLVTAGANPVRNPAGDIVASDWRDCDGDLVQCADNSGLLLDAITALEQAAQRYKAGKPLRLDGAGMFAVRSTLENYAELLQVLPHKTMVRVHRLTEKRISEIISGKRRAPDVVVVDL